MDPPCVHPSEISRPVPQDKLGSRVKLTTHLHLVTRSKIACCLIKHKDNFSCVDCTLHISMNSIIKGAGTVMMSQSIGGYRTPLSFHATWQPKDSGPPHYVPLPLFVWKSHRESGDSSGSCTWGLRFECIISTVVAVAFMSHPGWYL
jgi:hypothetical protein